MRGAASVEAVDIGRGTDQLSQLGFSRRDALKAVGKLIFDIGCRDISRPKPFLIHNRGNERNIVLDSFDMESVERRRLGVERGIAIFPVRDQFGDHRVIKH